MNYKIKILLLIFIEITHCSFGHEVICENSAYPPPKTVSLPVYSIDLDQPPIDRWTNLISQKATELRVLIVDVQSLLQHMLGTKIYDYLFNTATNLEESIPSPYKEEIIGIAKAANVPVEYIAIYNAFYEFFALCSSIVVEDANGNIHHGRNLDNGAFLGWDARNHTWKVTEALKPLAVTLEWKRSGKTLFKSVNFVGYIGILTAVKQNKFSFSLDKRFSLNNGIVGIFEWLFFHDHKQKWVSFLSREVLETANSFDEAKYYLSSKRLLAPVYFILAGVQPGQGVVITRGRDDYDLLPLNSSKLGEGSWYLVQTNYDHWKPDPFFDDRRTPAMHCLEESGQRNSSFRQLFNVLSTKPVLNKATVYTTLMQAQNGTMKSWVRNCPDPCWPW